MTDARDASEPLMETGIDPAGLALIDRWVQERRELWERRLDRLGDILAEDFDQD